MSAPQTGLGTPAGGDPLARIGRQLVAAAQARARRRRRAAQRAAGGVLTLVVLVAVGVTVAPFGGGTHPATSGEGFGEGNDPITLWLGFRSSFCTRRANGRDGAGATICETGQLLPPQLRRDGVAQTDARVEGERVVVTGLVSSDADRVVVSAAPNGGSAGESAEATFGDDTLAVGDGGPRRDVRPFVATVPSTGASHVSVEVTGPAIVPRSSTVPIGDPPSPTPQIAATRVELRVADGTSASPIVPLALQRLELLNTPAKVTGDGDRLLVELSADRGLDRAWVVAALAPGVLEFYDWEASALLQDGTTVAQGLDPKSPRASAISRGGGADGAIGRGAALALAASVGGDAQLVQAPAFAGGGADGRFYVLRGGPALSNVDVSAVSVVHGIRGGSNDRIELTDGGARRLHALTRTIAQRGASLALPGVSREEFLQHYAVVFDGRLIAVLPVDPDATPDGLTNPTIDLPGTFRAAGTTRLPMVAQFGTLPPLLERATLAGP